MFSLRNRVTYVASQLYWQHGTEGLSAARPRRSIRRLLDPKLEHMRTPGRLSGLARRVGCNSIAHRRRLCRLPLFAAMQLCSLSVAVLSLRLCHSFVCGLYSETSSGPSLSSERRPCPAGPRGQPVVQWVSSCNPAKQNTDTQTQQAHTHTHAYRHTHTCRGRGGGRGTSTSRGTGRGAETHIDPAPPVLLRCSWLTSRSWSLCCGPPRVQMERTSSWKRMESTTPQISSVGTCDGRGEAGSDHGLTLHVESMVD